jgi:hypothetical protein
MNTGSTVGPLLLVVVVRAGVVVVVVAGVVWVFVLVVADLPKLV